MSCEFPEISDYDLDDPSGTAASYDRAIDAAVNSGPDPQTNLRALYAKFDSIVSITGGAERAFTTVLGRPAEDPNSISGTRRAELAVSRDKYRAIAQIARDKRARVTEFLEDDPA